MPKDLFKHIIKEHNPETTPQTASAFNKHRYLDVTPEVHIQKGPLYLHSSECTCIFLVGYQRVYVQNHSVYLVSSG